MIHVLLISNPFQPLTDLQRFVVFEDFTAREWLANHFGTDFVEFDRPTVLQWNGELIMREEWETRRMKDGDVLAFVHVPGGVDPFSLIIIAVVAIVVAIGTYLLMPDPKIPADNTESANSVYTLRGQTNKFRPNEPIEVMYGKCRHWPSYACRPYSEYIGNQQYQFSLFCVGQGYFNITSMQLDDTATSAFDEVEIEIIPPNGDVTLVESNVYTAVEVANIELLGPNEDDYVGISGPYVVNDSGTKVHRLAVDISFPQGLYKLNDEGKLRNQDVEILFQYREINDSGSAIGSWTTLKSGTITRKDNTPQRITYSRDVPYGRYQVRGQRVSDKPTSTKVSSQLRWESAKAYAKDVGSFGGVTLIAMKALATNSLNDNSSKSFNIIATRMLPKWTAEDGWGAREITRNPIWSFCDLFRASYGAKLSTQFLDMPTLAAMAEIFETRQDYFDWIFDGSLSVWEAARMILRVGRAIPIPQGSLITAVRDVPQSLPSAVFNQFNIVQGSLSKKLAMFEFQPFDGLIVEYTDPATWKTKEVKCILPGNAGTNLDRIKFPGCTNHNRAYREGMYTESRRKYQRKTLVFQTGLEGNIPSFMDLISVTHDTVRVGQGGMVIAYDSTTNIMTLSEQVTFATENIVHKIALRGDDGAMLGSPITCTIGPAPNQVVLAHDPIAALDFSPDRVPPLYAFGVADVYSFLGKVSAIRPLDDSTVEITCLNYVPSVYNNEDDEIIEAIERPVIRNRTNPTVGWVTVSPVPDKADRIYADWLPEPGAASYILQTSYDSGLTWNPAGNYTSPPVELGANPGTIRARVAPFALNGNVIYTESEDFTVGSNVAPPSSPVLLPIQPPFIGLTATAKWGSVSGAEGYVADIYAAAVFLRTLDLGTALQADYTRAEYLADGGTGRDIEFQVKAYNAGGAGVPSILTQSNPVPVAPTTLAAVETGSPGSGNYHLTWAYPTIEGDELEFRVYASLVSGFTPGPGNLIATSGILSANISAPVLPLYWCVATVDKWGPELGVSTEAVIP